MRAAAAAAAFLVAGCSFLVDPPHYDVCVDSHGPRCDGDDLVVCEGELDVRTTCAGGCDQVTAACVVSSCGNGAMDDGEVCDDENRESGDGCRADCAKVEGCGDQIVDFGEPCDDGNQIDGDGCDCRSPDILVNTTWLGAQESPFVAVGVDGTALIAWEDPSERDTDNAGKAVRARLVRGGSLVGEDQVVNLETEFNQEHPWVAASATGDGFLVVWDDGSGSDGSGSAVRGRIIDANGVLSGPDFLVPSTTIGDQIHPVAVGLPDGGYAVAWEDHSLGPGDDMGAAIRLRFLDADGNPGEDDVVVNTTTNLAQTEPALAIAASGEILVVWEDESLSPSDNSERAIRGRRIAANRTFAGDDFPVNTTIAGDQIEPLAVAIADGDFLVIWTDASGAPADGGDIRARRVPASGDPVGSDVVVNTISAGTQEHPAVASLAGAIALVWEDESFTAPDTSESAVRMRWLDGDGQPREMPDQLVNAIVDDDQGEASVAGMPDGSVIVVWEDESKTLPDDQEDSIRMRIVAPP